MSCWPQSGSALARAADSTPGSLSHPLDELPAEAVYRARFRIARTRERNLHGEKVVRVKSQTHGMHGGEAANQQCGAT